MTEVELSRAMILNQLLLNHGRGNQWSPRQERFADLLLQYSGHQSAKR